MLTTNYFFLLTLTLCLGLFCLRGSRRCVQFNDTCLVVCMCVSVCGHAPCVDALRASEARSVGSLELELHEVLSHLDTVHGITLRFCRRAESTLVHRTISPAPQ